MKPLQFQTHLLNWFDAHGRKHLPWQHHKTPYRVWISEIMLQQTQVATVIPYFERFMQTFPDLSSLASAPLDQVLHLWAGLGYYSRARNLHRAALLIMDQFKGEFPQSADALQTLPGIGKSTAGAIIAIAFNKRAPILDGNVKRVMARFHGIQTPINEKETEQILWQLAEQYTPSDRIADYTQAMMDLGATLCTRSQAQCRRCPFLTHCVAYQQNKVNMLPIKNLKRELPIKVATLLVLKKRGHIFLYKRPAKGIWGGLWSLPEIPGKPSKKEVKHFGQQYLQSDIKTYQALVSFRHSFTHYHLDIYPIVIEMQAPMKLTFTAAEKIWYNPHKPKAIGLPKPIQSIMDTL